MSNDKNDDDALDLTQWTSIDAVADGGLLAGVVGDERIFVSRRGFILKAYSAVCPHISGPLDKGIVADGQIRCPWHHACFDLETGEAVKAPAFDALKAYPVEVKGNRFKVGAAEAPKAPHSGKGDPVRGTMAIVGGGAAGFAAADALRKLGWAGAISIFSEEPDEPYDRTLLTKDYLEGTGGDDWLPIARHSLADLGVDFHGGVRVQQIDAAGRRLGLANGDERTYAKLLLATGAAPRRPDFPGGDLPHVMTLRSLGGCRRILAKATANARVAVIGGSFIAMEAAASLRGRGLSVDVIVPEGHPLEKVLGRQLSDLVVQAHADKGVRLHFGAKVASVEGGHVRLEGGLTIDADLVVVGIGVGPSIALAEAAGLKLDRGVLVNSRLQTSDPNIFAAGDIARWPDPHTGDAIRVEHWVVAERQGQTAAANMLGRDEPFTMVPFFWTKHFDLSIRYIGHAETWDETIVEGDLSKRDGLVRFRRDGRDLAVATVERDKDSLREEVALEQSVDG
jgi:NADPH-dependent 2,4-dienoyl-CoA reductase/sulfur reductase-like enzyme/nitrite reductase/ring-hydroxylating ferredoxin subunit